MDRDQDSKTYGSFDRNYWLLKIRPFSSSPLQQSVLTLALVYLNKFEGNIYYKSSRVKKWAQAGMRYWMSIQNSNGSFDEYFKNEGSFPSTAFTLYAVSESYLALQMDESAIETAIVKSANYLSGKRERFALNQEIAAISSIYNTYLITKDQRYQRIYQERLKAFIRLQTSEGYFEEHCGMDVGYLTVTLSQLFDLYAKTNDQELLSVMNKVVCWLSYFIHPDGTVGGVYGTRNTTFVSLYGLQGMAQESEVASRMVNLLVSKNITFVNGIDDRYIMHFLGYSIVKALLIRKQCQSSYLLPFETSCYRIFNSAGIAIYSGKNVYCIVNLNKGGVFKLFLNGKHFLSDLGYKIIRGRKKSYTEFENDSCRWENSKTCLTVSKKFSLRESHTPSLLTQVVVNLYALLFRDLFWGLFRRWFILRGKSTKDNFIRIFRFGEDEIVVEDAIEASGKGVLKSSSCQSVKDIPSSKYFDEGELENQHHDFSEQIEANYLVERIISLENMSVVLKRDTE